ncbi:MAG: hypothetical protein MI975_17310 [Cytophagales bacterium]|nr:hypothetical protein [Cytophagales bacterium]
MNHPFEKTEFDANSGVTCNLKHLIFNKPTRYPIPLAHNIVFSALTSSNTGINLFNKTKANLYIRGRATVSLSEDLDTPFSAMLMPQANGMRKDRLDCCPAGINLRRKCPANLKQRPTWNPLSA